ncbi:DUF4139 domain-containing protein [Bacteroidota bacterium]
MKSQAIIRLLLLLLFPALIMGENNERNKVSVTVYNANLGVVKDIREIQINSGKSEIAITDVAQLIDPTSVHIKLDGEVLEQNYQYDLVSMDKILKKYIDKDIQLFGKEDIFIDGTLLSAYSSQIVVKKKDGGLVMIPNFNEYRISVGSLPEGLITKPTLVWLVNSNKSGKQEVEVSYQTSGMNWHAEYVAVLNEDDTELDLNSWVSIENRSGTTFGNANLKLVAGDVNLVKPEYDRTYRDGIRKEMVLSPESEKQFEEKEFFEYHIYDLQRPTTLSNNETKQISLFEAEGVKALKKYYYKSQHRYYRSSSEARKISVIVEFENKENYDLGIPMPKGKVRVYKSDGESIEFIGEDLIDHTPKNEKVKLKIGDAFDIVAEEKQTENIKITDKVYEQVWEIIFKNRKQESVKIEVERYLGNYWEILSSSHDYKKKDAMNIIFSVPVKADSQSVLKFKVRYTY